MPIKPLGNRVIVRPIEEDNKTPGGIVIPDTLRQKPQLAKVIAIGPGKAVDGVIPRASYKVGDTVMLTTREAGVPFDGDNGQKVLIIERGDVLGVVNA